MDTAATAGTYGVSILAAPRNILFLDIDGVLNSIESDLALSCNGWNPVSVRLLEQVCTIARAGVVMSSSWRGLKSVAELQAFLREGGAPALADHLVGRTPYMDEMPEIDTQHRRGGEIARWLEHNARWVINYLIVDDHNDMRPSQAAHFVHTDITYGFWLGDYVRSLKILAPQHPDAQRVIRRAPQ